MSRQAVIEVLRLIIIRMCLRDPFRRFSAYGKVFYVFPLAMTTKLTIKGLGNPRLLSCQILHHYLHP